MREQGIDIPVLDDGVKKAELMEVGKCGLVGGSVWEAPEADVEAGERATAEDVVGERHVERPGAVEEDEVLDLLGGEAGDQALERVLLLVEGGAGDTHGSDGARVSGHTERDAAHGIEDAVPFGGLEVGVVAAHTQRQRQRVERTMVRAASLVGRREMTLESRSLERRLMWSWPSPCAGRKTADQSAPAAV